MGEFLYRRKKVDGSNGVSIRELLNLQDILVLFGRGMVVYVELSYLFRSGKYTTIFILKYHIWIFIGIYCQ